MKRKNTEGAESQSWLDKVQVTADNGRQLLGDGEERVKLGSGMLYLHVCTCSTCMPGTSKGQKKMLDPCN